MSFEELFREVSREPDNPTRVVNLRREPYDVYIGRAGKGHDGYFGNPVRRDEPCPVCSETHTSKGSTLPCFERYARQRIERDPTYRERVQALYGKTLGCFCKPVSACHGDILAHLAMELQG